MSTGYSTDGRKFVVPSYHTPKKTSQPVVDVPEEHPAAKIKVNSAARKASGTGDGFFLTEVGIENHAPEKTSQEGVASPHVKQKAQTPAKPSTQLPPTPQPKPAQSPATKQLLRNSASTPQKPVPTPSPARRTGRPSLSDQLAAIASKSDSIISDIRKSISKDGGTVQTPKLMVFCKNFVVGGAESQGSSAVQFHETKCCYAFHHPTEKKISMEMWYRDMAEVRIDESKGTFQFRITKPLEHFMKDYNPSNPDHVLSMTFTTKKELISFKGKALPYIRQVAVS